MAGLRDQAMTHYHAYGWREGRKPNLYFDPRWYLQQNPEVAEEGIDPLLHYVTVGEAAGRRPSGWFDPAWYRRTYEVPDGLSPLRHYLLHRAGGTVSAMAEFDSPFYLKAYPDVAAAGLDPLEHYMVQGFREARRPFAGFDPAFYRQRYLGGETECNPLLHYMAHRNRPDVHPSLPSGETTGAARGAPPHPGRAAVRDQAGTAGDRGAPRARAGLLPAAVPRGGPQRRVVGPGLHRVDQRRARTAALRRPLPAAHPARPRPLPAGGHVRAAPAGGDGARRRHRGVRVLLLLVQPGAAARRAAGGAARRPHDRAAVLPDVGQRELDPALGRRRRGRADRPGPPPGGRAAADRLLRPATSPTRATSAWAAVRC